MAASDVPLMTIVTNTADNNDNQNSSSKLINNKEIDSADHVVLPFDPSTVISDTTTQIPEGFNLYRNKKTLTQGLMDIALFSANANQLRYILDHGSQSQAYFYIAASLIVISLILQVAVGLLLLLSIQYNISVECQREMVYKYGNYVVVGIFLITIVNIFIAAFGGPAVVLS